MNGRDPAVPLKVLIATVDGGGNLPPFVTVARELTERGHKVRVLGEPSSREDIRSSGAQFRPWNHAPHRYLRTPEACTIRDWAQPTPQAGARHVIDQLICGPAGLFAADLAEELERESADIVLTLDMLLGVLVACEARGQRVAVLAPNLSLFPLPGIPPFGAGLGPPVTEEARQVINEVAGAVQSLFDTGLAALNAARCALGLPPLTHTFDQIHSADAYWLLTSAAFDFAPAALPDRVAYVGPLSSDPPWALAGIEPTWDLDEHHPLVLVSLSTSYQHQVDTLRRLVAALSTLSVRVLVTLGPSLPPTALPSAGNVRVVPELSHEAVMPRCALVATHGGHGTVVRALRHRVPLLILPHGRDQADNAIRVTARGAGLALDQTASVEQIRLAAVRLLSEKHFLSQARILGDRIAQDAEQCDLIARIEALASRPA